ncbi:unnamed protein product [Rhizoctonia solani]|uniref:Uncharacterized protein n=1 Tax=Rhizoctonia solani TaxID=456999 RepID=A0A8H3C3N6_9AGAM|nr:unnamed protein product [Rhizoctonia solani]CAE6473279.1 unnamed protein product [Rhizoctonia solani]
MARDVESPYPANAVFGVHKGFKVGVFTEYRDLLAQTADYPGGKELWAVFTDPQHAQEYVSTGRCPVPPLDQKPTAGAIPVPDSSAQSLPTPDASPETDAQPPILPARQRPSTSAPLTARATQPHPATTRKPQAVKPDLDSDGDTEPEDDFKPPSASLPATTARNALPRRPYKPGITQRAVVRSLSGNSGIAPTPPPLQNAAPPAPGAATPFTAPVSAPGPSRRTQHGPPTASGSERKAAPAAPAPVSSTSTLVPIRVPAPALVPEFTRQPRPHGTYEQCDHCDGTGWIPTPAQPTDVIPPPPPPVVQTPSRPRANPTTNLRIISDSDHATGSGANKNRTPSGSRLRVASIGGVGPERTPKRDPKRVVSDSVTTRRARATSDGAKDKGKGKARAVEPMDTDSEAGSSAYKFA